MHAKSMHRYTRVQNLVQIPSVLASNSELTRNATCVPPAFPQARSHSAIGDHLVLLTDSAVIADLVAATLVFVSTGIFAEVYVDNVLEYGDWPSLRVYHLVYL